jgi:serine/threonine protein kinase
LKAFGTFPETLIRNFIIQVLQGLEYLHAEGVIHRDIKSANILSAKDGTVKLGDFGIASGLENSKGVFTGSAYWLAPEVINCTGATYVSDIWSLGCTCIELYTGKPPYFELEAVSALFRIATDDHVPLPLDISNVKYY